MAFAEPERRVLELSGWRVGGCNRHSRYYLGPCELRLLGGNVRVNDEVGVCEAVFFEVLVASMGAGLIISRSMNLRLGDTFWEHPKRHHAFRVVPGSV